MRLSISRPVTYLPCWSLTLPVATRLIVLRAMRRLSSSGSACGIEVTVGLNDRTKAFNGFLILRSFLPPCLARPCGLVALIVHSMRKGALGRSTSRMRDPLNIGSKHTGGWTYYGFLI